MNILATLAPHTRGKSGYFPVIHWRISDCIIDYIFHSAICTSGCPHTALTDSQHTMQKHNFLQTSSAQVGKFALWACIGSNLAGNKICYWNVLETLTTNFFPQQSILDKFKSIMCFLTAKTKPFFLTYLKFIWMIVYDKDIWIFNYPTMLRLLPVSLGCSLTVKYNSAVDSPCQENHDEDCAWALMIKITQRTYRQSSILGQSVSWPSQEGTVSTKGQNFK